MSCKNCEDLGRQLAATEAALALAMTAIEAGCKYEDDSSSPIVERCRECDRPWSVPHEEGCPVGAALQPPVREKPSTSGCCSTLGHYANCERHHIYGGEQKPSEPRVEGEKP